MTDKTVMSSELIKAVDDFEVSAAQALCLLGFVPAAHCQADPRFSYYLFIPKQYHTWDNLQLIVGIHGSDRNPDLIRKAFSSLAETKGCAVLAPLFPIGLVDPNDTNNYKMILYKGVRYDHVLLSMVEEVHARYLKVRTDKFLMYGFSGGGQFGHRFAYLHPEKLLGVVVGAPGTITLLDLGADFPAGLGNIEDIFGRKLSWDSLKDVPVMFIVGEMDTDTFNDVARGRKPQPGGRVAGTARLAESWRRAGASPTVVTVPGASHEEEKMLPYATQFLEKLLTSNKDPANRKDL